jgi:transglutaminase-like putative cysteine protease
MGAYARWTVLATGQRRLTMQSAALIGAAVVAIRVLGVPRTLRIASRPIHGPTRTVIGDVATAVDRAGRYVPGATCLPKALVLAWMLRRAGLDAAVRFGVKTDGGFDAHAWVESNGVAVETVPAGYAPIPHR